MFYNVSRETLLKKINIYNKTNVTIHSMILTFGSADIRVDLTYKNLADVFLV